VSSVLGAKVLPKDFGICFGVEVAVLYGVFVEGEEYVEEKEELEEKLEEEEEGGLEAEEDEVEGEDFDVICDFFGKRSALGPDPPSFANNRPINNYKGRNRKI
jgi:hypothetical protein